MNFTALKNEIVTDPTGKGYATPYALNTPAGDKSVADLLNAKNGNTVGRGVVNSHELVALIAKGAWDALSAGDKEGLRFLLAPPQIDVSSATVQGWLSAIFPNSGATQTTRQALIAAFTRPASRAEVVLGPGTFVTAENVGETRRV